MWWVLAGAAPGFQSFQLISLRCKINWLRRHHISNRWMESGEGRIELATQFQTQTPLCLSLCTQSLICRLCRHLVWTFFDDIHAKHGNILSDNEFCAKVRWREAQEGGCGSVQFWVLCTSWWYKNGLLTYLQITIQIAVSQMNFYIIISKDGWHAHMIVKSTQTREEKLRCNSDPWWKLIWIWPRIDFHIDEQLLRSSFHNNAFHRHTRRSVMKRYAVFAMACSCPPLPIIPDGMVTWSDSARGGRRCRWVGLWEWIAGIDGLQ